MAAESDPKDARKRQRFVLERLRENGKVTNKELEEHGFKTHSQSLSNDLKLFQDLGLPVERTSGEFRSTLPEARRSLYEDRKDEKSEQKRAIGILAAGLITQIPVDRWRTDAQKDLAAILESMPDPRSSESSTYKDRLLNSLRETVEKYNSSLLEQRSFQAVMSDIDSPNNSSIPYRQTLDHVKRFVDDYASKRHRTICLDSGTTTEAICEQLKSGLAGRVSGLRVLTNAPRIERLLEEPNTPINVIGVGGELRKDTSARTGDLFEQCIQAWSHMRVDIALVGATSLRIDRLGRLRGFACDSESEARTKAMFLDLADLRCVVMDSSKCSKSSSSAFEFASVSGEVVHVVIMDKEQNETEKVKECIDSFEQQGIVVLRAPVKSSE